MIKKRYAIVPLLLVALFITAILISMGKTIDDDLALSFVTKLRSELAAIQSTQNSPVTKSYPFRNFIDFSDWETACIAPPYTPADLFESQTGIHFEPSVANSDGHFSIILISNNSVVKEINISRRYCHFEVDGLMCFQNEHGMVTIKLDNAQDDFPTLEFN